MRLSSVALSAAALIPANSDVRGASLPALEREALYQGVGAELDPALIDPPAPQGPSAQDPKVSPAADQTKRIEAVMQDPKLSPEERLKKVQEITAAPAPTAPPAAPGAPAAASPKEAEPQVSKGVGAADQAERLKAVMQDPKLSPEERLEKVREITAATPATPTAAPAATTAPPPPGSPNPSTQGTPSAPVPAPAAPNPAPDTSGQPSASPSFDPKNAAAAFDAALNPPVAFGISVFGLGTDKDGLSRVFTGLSREQFDQIVVAYRDVHENDLRDALKEELGDKHAEFVKSHPVLQMTSADTVAAEIRAALNPGVLSAVNVVALTELVLQVPGSELSKVRAAYETRYGGTLSADVGQYGEALKLLVSGDRAGYFAQRIHDAKDAKEIGAMMQQSEHASVAARYKELFGRDLTTDIAKRFAADIHELLDLGATEFWYNAEEMQQLANLLLDMPAAVRIKAAEVYGKQYGEPFNRAVGKVGSAFDLLARGEKVQGITALIRTAQSADEIEALIKRMTPEELSVYRQRHGDDIQNYHSRTDKYADRVSSTDLAGLKYLVAGHRHGMEVAELDAALVSGKLEAVENFLGALPDDSFNGVLTDYSAITGKPFFDGVGEWLSAEDVVTLRTRLAKRLPPVPSAPK